MKFQSELLRMARTREKKEHIKWIWARNVFFYRKDFAEGLAFARQCEHEDARFLASVFPGDAPASEEEASQVFWTRAATRDATVGSRCWTGMVS